MESDELLGVFPIGNPIPYTGQVEVLHAENTPPLLTWYHGTWENRVASIARYGLLPSCWFGGDCCCVYGFDSREVKRRAKYGDWVVEIKSRAEVNADLKAWWVPPSRIMGAWHQGRFHPGDALLLLPGIDISTQRGQPACLDELCHTQYRIWQEAVMRSTTALHDQSSPSAC